MVAVGILINIILLVLADSRKTGPPKKTKDVETVIVNEGETGKLVCPIYGEPQPIIEWEKDGEEIDYSWERMLTQGNNLEIEKVKTSDTGVYVCRGVNGFGIEKAKIELVVAGLSFPYFNSR